MNGALLHNYQYGAARRRLAGPLTSGAAVAEAGRRATAVALRRRAGRSQCSPRPLLLQAMRRELHDAVAAADDRASWKATIRTTSSGSS